VGGDGACSSSSESKQLCRRRVGGTVGADRWGSEAVATVTQPATTVAAGTWAVGWWLWMAGRGWRGQAGGTEEGGMVAAGSGGGAVVAAPWRLGAAAGRLSGLGADVDDWS
jgi:hypothetical protein